MKPTTSNALRLGLIGAAMALTAPAAMAAGQCEVVSHQLSNGKVEIEARNLTDEPQMATAWFQPRYSYAGPGSKADGLEIVRQSRSIEPNGQRTLVVEGRSSTSRMKEPSSIQLHC